MLRIYETRSRKPETRNQKPDSKPNAEKLVRVQDKVILLSGFWFRFTPT